jgi:hypothetical protein
MPNIVSVHSYTGLSRELANRIKNAADDRALQQAAEEMAERVPDAAVLVPAPSSSGRNSAMLVLAQNIAQLVPHASVVEAVVRTTPLPSKMLLRRAGKYIPSFADQVASMRLAHPLTIGDPVWVVDNVVTSGDTIRAVEAVIGFDVSAIVYAEVKRSARRLKEADGRGRVCISGSREYAHLDNVDRLIEALPRDLTIVHGGAAGVDARADAVARALGFDVEVCRADWSRYGRRAGPLRNRTMVASSDFLYAFWDGRSRGTASAIQAAVDEDVPFEVVENR